MYSIRRGKIDGTEHLMTDILHNLISMKG